MLDDILATLKAIEGAEEISVTVTTVTVTLDGSVQVTATSADLHVEDGAATGSDGLSHSHRAVLAAVNAAHVRPRDVERAVGLKHRRVADLLKDLVESGDLTQPRYGRYQAAA